MGFFKEFKEFAVKGNVMDMAVGVIIGGAFGKIVTSLVNDILMPPIAAVMGNTNFSDLRIEISRVRDVVSSGAELITGSKAATEAAEPITGITVLSSSSASISSFWRSAYSSW